LFGINALSQLMKSLTKFTVDQKRRCYYYYFFFQWRYIYSNLHIIWFLKLNIKYLIRS